MQYARASVAAIAAVIALSPTYAAPSKPIVDLSQSPSLTEETANATLAKTASNGVDEQTMELGGGALALLVLGGTALVISRSKGRRKEESWCADELVEPVAESELMTLDRPVVHEEPVMLAPPMSAFDWSKAPRRREGAAGDAVPVDPDAGLPESLDETETA